jgi:succinate dehydrogenase hydrophobic anchor subunit
MGDIEINFSYYTKTVTYYTKVPVVHRTKNSYFIWLLVILRQIHKQNGISDRYLV